MAEKSCTTNNVTANIILSPFIFLGIILYTSYLKIPFFSLYHRLYGGIGIAVFSTFIYLFSSHFYQPDLDNRENRPGQKYFPIGKYPSKIIGELLYHSFFKFIPFKKGALFIKNEFYLLFYPLTKIWYFLWFPFSLLFTHRGVVHWPILGVLIRNTYLLFCSCLIFKITGATNLLDFSLVLYKNSMPWNYLDPAFCLIWLPVYMADFTHFLVDLYDSLKQGYSFCPPKNKRGLFIVMIQSVWVVKKSILGP